MGSLLIIFGLIVGFLLLYLTYRAGFAAGQSTAVLDREELERLKDRIDFLQADNDSLLRRVRKQKETISPGLVFGQSSLNPEAEQKKTAALRGLVDSVRFSPHITCGDSECPKCRSLDDNNKTRVKPM